MGSENENISKNDAILYAKSSENDEWIQVGKIEDITQIICTTDDII